MSGENRHHLFHRKEENEGNVNVSSDYAYGSGADQGAYGSSDYQTGSDYNAASGYNTGSAYQQDQTSEYERSQKEEKHHKRMEHVGELGTMAAGAYALYEKHETKKDPENAGRHKIEEEIAAAAAVGSGGMRSTSITRRRKTSGRPRKLVASIATISSKLGLACC
uniref:Uncharacterized protein n=1 Tax=Picea sitchensis TaxID=3332 RepID=B8LRX3_PICSI|nr:unknown [Picea sitchensis]